MLIIFVLYYIILYMYKKILKAIKPSEDVDEIIQLHKKPIPEKRDEGPTFQDFIPNYTHQADILHLPTAKFGYKYLLVVVDDNTRKFDAYPLKIVSSLAILNGFKYIYKNSENLELPHNIEFDNGTAFHGEVEQYFNDMGIHIRYASTNRHRQQALVETKNQLIGNIIFQLLNVKELKDKKKSIKKSAVDWYKSKKQFESLIDSINNHQTTKPLKTQIKDTPITTTFNKNLLNVGDRVRVLLDYPINISHEKKLIGKFRSADIRWSPDVKKIKWTVLKPGEPPMYRVSGEEVLRTINQLQPV